jgi:hypothetical protein
MHQECANREIEDRKWGRTDSPLRAFLYVAPPAPLSLTAFPFFHGDGISLCPYIRPLPARLSTQRRCHRLSSAACCCPPSTITHPPPFPSFSPAPSSSFPHHIPCTYKAPPSPIQSQTLASSDKTDEWKNQRVMRVQLAARQATVWRSDKLDEG